MDQGVRERAEARLRALFEENPAAHAAMVMKIAEMGCPTVKALYEFVDRASDEQWQEGIRLARVTISCRCPNCNLYPEPPIMGNHVGIG